MSNLTHRTLTIELHDEDVHDILDLGGIPATLQEHANRRYETDSPPYRVVLALSRDLSPRVTRAAEMRAGVIACEADPAALAWLRSQMQEVEGRLSGGPAGPIGDDAPDNDDWLPGWQREARLSMKAALLRLVTQADRDDRAKSLQARAYLAGYSFRRPVGGVTCDLSSERQ